ncbi:MAG: flagellar brake protein, partial [Gallionellaceae bacterium]|nr:flagellar brake protein [Gallionellaceae bacterium]
MNLQPVAIESIPLGKPLPWRLYDNNGRPLFARGEIVENQQQLESMLVEGLMRDVDELSTSQAASELTAPEGAATSNVFPPPGIKPQVWERVQLCMYVGSTPVHYSAHLIGYIKGVSIMVTTPLVNGIPITLRDGEQVEVRMVTGSNICIFSTALQRICISPHHYMHLEYPSTVHVQELRKSPRARVNFSATATNAQGGQEIVHIVNLSLHGAQIHVPAKVGQKGDSLKLVFHAAMDDLNTTL